MLTTLFFRYFCFLGDQANIQTSGVCVECSRLFEGQRVQADFFRLEIFREGSGDYKGFEITDDLQILGAVHDGRLLVLIVANDTTFEVDPSPELDSRKIVMLLIAFVTGIWFRRRQVSGGEEVYSGRTRKVSEMTFCDEDLLPRDLGLAVAQHLEKVAWLIFIQRFGGDTRGLITIQSSGSPFQDVQFTTETGPPSVDDPTGP